MRRIEITCAQDMYCFYSFLSFVQRSLLPCGCVDAFCVCSEKHMQNVQYFGNREKCVNTAAV